MIGSVRLAAPNSLLFVLDPQTGMLPDSLAGSSIAATRSAVAIGTLSEFDGETRVSLGRVEQLPEDELLDLDLAWEGDLETDGQVAVMTVGNDELLNMTTGEIAHVQIWTNDPNEPDVIWVAVT